MLTFRQSAAAAVPLHQGRCNAAAPRRAVQLRAASADTAAAVEMPSSSQVTALLHTLTAPDMEIAELSLKMGDLQLRVRRSVEASAPAAAAPLPMVVAPPPTLQPSLQLAPAPYISMDEGPDVDSMDESLLYVTANRVGVFRRGKSKAKVGDQVKKGQILGAIEQLGTVVDVKAPQGGEIVSFKVSEGDAVEYGGALVCLAPYFGVEEAGVTSYRGV